MQIDRRQVVASGMTMASSVTAALTLPSIARGQDRLVIDAIGLHSHLKLPAERVVIASHYNYEDFTAIAGTDGWTKVVGMVREPWEDWRAADYTKYAKVIPGLAYIADIGGMSEFDADKVITLTPDVVICDASPDSLIGDQLRKLRRAEIPLVFLDFRSQTPQTHIASTHAIGRVMGTEARADEIAKLYEAAWQDVMVRASASPQ
jgi:iron complex transport system substrate-binding protein